MTAFVLAAHEAETAGEMRVIGDPSGIVSRAFPSKEEFRVWLTVMPADAVVTARTGCHDCPLALFLRAIGAGQHPAVGSNVWRKSDDDGAPHPLPIWARAFVIDVDRRLGKRVTAAECLAILDGSTP